MPLVFSTREMQQDAEGPVPYLAFPTCFCFQEPWRSLNFSLSQSGLSQADINPGCILLVFYLSNTKQISPSLCYLFSIIFSCVLYLKLAPNLSKEGSASGGVASAWIHPMQSRRCVGALLLCFTNAQDQWEGPLGNKGSPTPCSTQAIVKIRADG